MDNEKLEAVIDYFSDLREPLPTEVKNAIEDVFYENSDNDISKVICYYKTEVADLEENLTLKNDVELDITGNNKGKTNNIWTYYGGADYSLSEKINLINRETNEILEEISNLENERTTRLLDPSTWAVILHELVEWDSTKEDKEPTRTLTLHIYCPYDEYEEIDDSDVEFAKIYEHMRGENGK